MYIGYSSLQNIMAPKKQPIFRRGEFLMQINWVEDIENIFIDFMVVEVQLGSFVWPDKTDGSLFLAQDLFTTKHGLFFSEDFLLKKLGLLRDRFGNFQWLLKLDGVYYNPKTNIVTAAGVIWDYVMKEKYSAYQYRVSGEFKWQELSILFQDVVEYAQPCPDVVVLSSDSEGEPKEENAVGVPQGTVAQAEKGLISVVNISSTSEKSKEFNISDYLNYYSDSEGSSKTIYSDANSFNCGAAGIRTHPNPSPKSGNNRTYPKKDKTCTSICSNNPDI
ncbi:hypothetical protein ACP275_10G022900 [Erythranthe tilingii]